MRCKELFYQHYFKNTALGKHIDIKNFYNPDHLKLDKTKKTFSMSYIYLILSSEKFKQ